MDNKGGMSPLSPVTSIGLPDMEHLKDGLTCLISGAFGSSHRHCPYWHTEGKRCHCRCRRQAAHTKLLSAGSSNTLVIFWQTFRLMLLSPSQLTDKTSKTTQAPHLAAVPRSYPFLPQSHCRNNSLHPMDVKFFTS